MSINSTVLFSKTIFPVKKEAKIWQEQKSLKLENLKKPTNN